MMDPLEQRLQQILEAAYIDSEIDIQKEGTRFVVAVISAEFDDIDEGERQVQIWNLLAENLSEEEHRRVEFVFTISPRDEDEAA